jgi:phosphoserine phosphatase
VVFDLDGTITPVDSLWRYLHDAFGTWDLGKLAAQKYKRGEITYKEWAETDAGYWAGTPLSEVKELLKKIPYRPGARELFQELKQKDVKTAILSAGLSILAEKVAKDLGADFAIANELQSNDGRLTGGIIVRVGVGDKRRVIEQLAAKLEIPLSEVALVGDRAFDLTHPECLRIAFKPKDDNAREEADFIVEDDDLSTLLPYLA